MHVTRHLNWVEMDHVSPKHLNYFSLELSTPHTHRIEVIVMVTTAKMPSELVIPPQENAMTHPGIGG